jgi:hypothetical protein
MSGNRRPAVVIQEVTIDMLNGVVVVAPHTATEINIGDFCYLDTNVAKPANSLPDGGSEGANQIAFHDFFLGIALDHSAAGSATPIRFATRGRFRTGMLSAVTVVGDLMAMDENGAGNGLLPQQVVKVTDTSQAIGRISKSSSGATLFADVDIVSTIMYGGPMPA